MLFFFFTDAIYLTPQNYNDIIKNCNTLLITLIYDEDIFRYCVIPLSNVSSLVFKLGHKTTRRYPDFYLIKKLF